MNLSAVNLKKAVIENVYEVYGREINKCIKYVYSTQTAKGEKTGIKKRVTF